YGDAVVARSPDGGRVGLLVAGEVRTVDLEDGTLVHRADGAAAHAPGSGTDPEATDGTDGKPVLVWVDGVARVAWPEAGGVLHVPLADGWAIELDGDAEVDPDQSSGDGTTGPPFAIWVGDVPPDADVAAMRREQERVERAMRIEAEQRSRVPVTFRLVAHRDGRATVVHHEERSLVAGSTTLHWPPVVTPHGLLLRRSVRTARGGGADRDMQAPWLVTPDGQVRTLPFQLGVGPRDTLPDGRLLLPAYSALWWDGSDEAPTALALDGATEPLRIGPRAWEDAARPHRVLRDAFPELPVAWPPPEGDAGWHVVDARVDAAADEVVLLLVEGFPEPYPLEDEDPTAWALVAVALGGGGPVRGIAHGARPAGAGTAFAL
ncbi:hypothetical protein ACVU7I_10550, partial [Patulibacter sp. S7RM1-6]